MIIDQLFTQPVFEDVAGTIDYTKPGPITKSSMGHDLEYGIPVNTKGAFINPMRLPNYEQLPDDEFNAILTAYKTWLRDYLTRWPGAKMKPDGSMGRASQGLAPMSPFPSIQEAADPNKLIVSVTILPMSAEDDTEVKDFDLTGRFQGDARSQINQATAYLTKFFEARGINFTNFQATYQGQIITQQNVGSMEPQNDAERELQTMANQMRNKRPGQNATPALKEFAPSDDGEGPEKAQEILNKYYGPQNMAEAAQGHTIEAHGVRGMDRRTWHKTFKNTDQMIAWAEKHDAEIVGTRDLEQARHHNLSPAQQDMAEGKLGNAAALAAAIALGGAMGYKHATKDPNAEPTFKTKYERNYEVGEKLKKKIAGDQKNEDVAEGVAETVSMDQAKKVLRHYGADHFKTTSNELHFYKNGRPMSVDLIFNDDATRSVNLSQLNSATRRLKGQGVAKGRQINEVFADQGSGSTDRDNADYMKRRNAAKKAGYTGRETKAGTWRVFKDGNAVAAAGPFKSADEAAAWIKKHKQGITEMDKSQPSAYTGRDTGPREGPEKIAKPITKEKMVKHALDALSKSMAKKDDKKKDVKESDSLPQWKKDWYAKQKPNSWPKHPQPYHKPDWTKDLTPSELETLRGKKSNKRIQDIDENNDPLMKKLQRAMVQEGRVKELADDLKTMSDADFMKKYGKAKAAIRKDMKRVDEAAQTNYTPQEMADILSGKKTQQQVDAERAKKIDDQTDDLVMRVDKQGRRVDKNGKLLPPPKTWTNPPINPPPGKMQQYEGLDEQDTAGQQFVGTGTSSNWQMSVDIAAMNARKKAAQSIAGTNSFQGVQLPPGTKYGPQDTKSDGTGKYVSTYTITLPAPSQSAEPAPAAPGAALDSSPATSNMNGSMSTGAPAAVGPAAGNYMKVNELSTNKLSQYKTAAAKDAKKADQAGDFKRGDKRLGGMVQATKKQFDNDAKKVDESRAARRALMAKIVNSK
jgi:hypothetical protein